MEIIAGALSASISKTITSPFEVIKIRLQLNKEGYNGFSDCLIKMTRDEGINSLWKGNLINCIRFFPTQMINKQINGVVNELLFPLGKKQYNYDQQFVRGLFAGGLAGSFTLIFTYPFDLLRTRLTMDGMDGQNKYEGLIDCISKTYQEGGIKSFYKGIVLSMIGIIPYRYFYFVGYDLLKTLFLNSHSSFFLKFIIAQFNTIVAQILTYPLDTIRRYQMMGGYSDKFVETDFYHTFLQIVKHKGFFSLFDGCLINTIRSVGASIAIVAFEIISK